MEKYVIIDKDLYSVKRYTDDSNEILNNNEVLFSIDDLMSSNVKNKNLSSLIDRIKMDSKWRLYPIYSFNIKFKCKKTVDNDWIDNGFNTKVMYKEPQSIDELERTISNYIMKMESKYYEVHPVIDYSYKLDKYETWCLTWFSHYTFDVGQTDDEVLQSFEDYVRRYEDMQGIYTDEVLKNSSYECLMGAEDRWRWCSRDRDEFGKIIDYDSEPHYEVPCRCSVCTKAGIISIDH